MGNDQSRNQWMEFERGFTSEQRRRQGPRAGDPFDPWDHNFRNNQAKMFWDMAMEMEHGHKNGWGEKAWDDEYDEENETEFQKKFYESFTDENWDEEPEFWSGGQENYYYRNPNSQRYHYKDYDNWDSQRSSYEKQFEQKRNFKYKFDKTGKEEKYWEDAEPIKDRFTSFGYYDDVDYDEWEDSINKDIPKHHSTKSQKEARFKSHRSKEKEASYNKNDKKEPKIKKKNNKKENCKY